MAEGGSSHCGVFVHVWDKTPWVRVRQRSAARGVTSAESGRRAAGLHVDAVGRVFSLIFVFIVGQ